MYYNSNSWSGVNNGGPRPQPGYPSPAERFQYQDPSTYNRQPQQVMSKYHAARRMGEQSIPRPHLSQTDPTRNPWDGKMTHPAYSSSMPYGVNTAQINQYGQNRMPGRPSTGSIVDQPAMRMPATMDNGRYGQMQHPHYSPAYSNSAIHTPAKMGQGAQGSYEQTRDATASIYTGQSYGVRQPHPFSVSRMTSPPGPGYLRPCQPASSPQVFSHSAVPVCTAMTSPNYRMGIHQGSRGNTCGRDVAYPDAAPAPFKHSTNYASPSHPAKYQTTSVDYRPPFDKTGVVNQGTPLPPTPPRPQIASGDMYERNFAYGTLTTEKPVCAMPTPTQSVPQVEVPTSIMSKQSSTFSANMPVPELSGDFNLDSLLDGPLESGGSFMQQLEDVAPETFATSAKETSQTSSDEKSSPLRPTLGTTAFASPIRSEIGSNPKPPSQASMSHLITSNNMPTSPVAGAVIGPTVTQAPVNMPYRSSSVGVAPCPSFVPSVQQAQVQRPMYQASEHPVQGNLNLVRAPQHPAHPGAMYPEANIHGTARQPRPKLDDRWNIGQGGYLPSHKPNCVGPGYGAPVAEAVPRVRMLPPPLAAGGQEVESQQQPTFAANKQPVPELSAPGVKNDAIARGVTTTPKKAEVKSSGSAAADVAGSKKKKIKRPAATVKLKKKKRKKGEDTDDFGGNLPPISTASNAEVHGYHIGTANTGMIYAQVPFEEASM